MKRSDRVDIWHTRKPQREKSIERSPGLSTATVAAATYASGIHVETLAQPRSSTRNRLNNSESTLTTSPTRIFINSTKTGPTLRSLAEFPRGSLSLSPLFSLFTFGEKVPPQRPPAIPRETEGAPSSPFPALYLAPTASSLHGKDPCTTAPKTRGRAGTSSISSN